MSPPCRKCGATKTEPIPHGIVYRLARASGYRLCQCSACRKLRLIRRHDDKSSTSLKSEKEGVTGARVAEGSGALETAEKDLKPEINQPVAAAASSDGGLRRCPDCGSTKYHRTKRTALEHLLLRPRMARCEMCWSRFPYPKHRHRTSSPAKLGEAAATVPRSAEEKKGAKVAQEETKLKSTKLVNSADSSGRGAQGCPNCGSTKYHRTKRTPLEHFLLRPRMARCENCGVRFPYPRHHHRSSGSAKSGQAATVPRSAEEKKGAKAAQEETKLKSTKLVNSADSSGRGAQGCPNCGSTKYHRTKRTSLEHFLLRPRMARCENCGVRFPHPGHHDKSPEPVKSGEAAKTASRVGGEERVSTTGEENIQPNVTKEKTAAHFSNPGARGCPACGSTSYRRTPRTTLERILLRPKMARCRKCKERFPYPGG